MKKKPSDHSNLLAHATIEFARISWSPLYGGFLRNLVCVNYTIKNALQVAQNVQVIKIENTALFPQEFQKSWPNLFVSMIKHLKFTLMAVWFHNKKINSEK
jgi:hypothetical protein